MEPPVLGKPGVHAKRPLQAVSAKNPKLHAEQFADAVQTAAERGYVSPQHACLVFCGFCLVSVLSPWWTTTISQN